ncbi:hypothetical protein EII11_06240 [Schaalia canis]|uniref:Uncharacterized protein n=2 Tax=Schaalia canis TaxID=100469 RepID=A0A3P1SE99_9ACTO|nr:hypothetical protein EII11_06240 [Schaalia canis]
MKSRGRSTAFLLCFALVLASCSASDAGDISSPEEATPAPQSSNQGLEGATSIPQIVLSDALPQKNQDRWVLPTDAYRGRAVGNYVENAKIVAEVHCMQQKGYADFPLHIKLFQPEDEVYPWGSSKKIFNEGIASRFGYRLDGNNSYVEGAPPPDTYASTLGGDAEQHLEQCRESAMQRITPDEYEALKKEMQRVSSLKEIPQTEEEARALLGEDPRSDAERQLGRLALDLQQPGLLDAAQKWRECMAPLGIADLPEFPWETASYDLPISLQDRWNWDTGGTPSQEEVQYAVHDANCRRSSGWFDTLYEEEWKLCEEFVTAHRAELAPLLERQRQHVKNATEVYLENGYGQ